MVDFLIERRRSAAPTFGEKFMFVHCDGGRMAGKPASHVEDWSILLVRHMSMLKRVSRPALRVPGVHCEQSRAVDSG